MKKEQVGRTMVEMLGVLTIVAILSVAVYSFYSMASGKLKSNQTIDLVQKMIQDIMLAHSVRTDYYGVAPTENNAAGYFLRKNIISPSLCVDQNECSTGAANGPIIHPMGGEIRILVDRPSRTLTIQLADVPKAACANIAAADWGTGGGTSNVVQSLIVGVDETITEFPADVATVTGLCSRRSNNLRFTLRPLRN